MRLIKLACPQCGAKLPLTNINMEWVTCNYCSTSFYVQRDRAQPPPMGHPTVYYPPPTPVHSTAIVVIVSVMFGLPMLLGIGSAVVEAIRSKAPSIPKSSPMAAAPAAPEGPVALRGAMLYDANGDGADDIIVWLRSSELSAFDGNNGKQIWVAPTRTAGSNVASEARSGLIGDCIISDFARKLHGFDAKTGSLLWTTPMDSRVMKFCAIGPRDLQITVEDVESFRVNLSNGALTKEREIFRCSPIERDDEPHPKTRARMVSNQLAYTLTAPKPIPGLDDAKLEYQLPTVNGQQVMLGYRKRGRVPIAVAMKDKKVAWRAELSKTGAASGSGSPSHAALSHGRLLVTHNAGGPWVLGCLDAANGKHLWEVEIPRLGAISGVMASDRAVFVQHGTVVSAFAFKDGRLLYEIGR